MSIAAHGTDALTDSFKAAMRRQTSSVAILATALGSDRFGMIVTTAISISMDPPSMLISVNQSASMYRPLCATRKFSVNLLSNQHEPLVPAFAGKVKGNARFENGDWVERDGVPVLQDSQASLICTVVQDFAYGTHHLFIGKVQSVAMGDNDSILLWHEGGPHAAAYVGL